MIQTGYRVRGAGRKCIAAEVGPILKVFVDRGPDDAVIGGRLRRRIPGDSKFAGTIAHWIDPNNGAAVHWCGCICRGRNWRLGWWYRCVRRRHGCIGCCWDWRVSRRDRALPDIVVECLLLRRISRAIIVCRCAKSNCTYRPVRCVHVSVGANRDLDDIRSATVASRIDADETAQETIDREQPIGSRPTFTQVPAGVAVAVGSMVSVAVGSGVSVAVGSSVSVAVGSGVSVAVGSGVSVAVGSGVSVAA